MQVKINSNEVAEAIAAKVEQVTGHDCDAFSNETGAVIVYRRTTVIAQINPLFDVMDVQPVGGPHDGETVYIPLEAETIFGIREIVNAMDRATSHILNAANH